MTCVESRITKAGLFPFLLVFFSDGRIVRGFWSGWKGKVPAMNILAKLGVGAFVIFGVLSGGYYLTDLRANEAARLAVEAFKKDFEASVPSSTVDICLLYTSPSPRDRSRSRMPSSA